MSIGKQYRDFFAKSRHSLAYRTQIARRDFTEELQRWMETRGVGQTRLAETLGLPLPFITKVLRTNANLSIDAMVRLALALDCQIRIRMQEIDRSTADLDPSTAVLCEKIDRITEVVIKMQRSLDSIPWFIASAAIIASGVSVASRLGWL